MMAEWHLITGEYPPMPGGVADYSRHVAVWLREAGGRVHVWCPGEPGGEAVEGDVVVHREPAGFSPAGMRRMGEALDRQARPRRLLVQWVPHAYGYRAMNVPFCAWLLARSRLAGDEVLVMVHEAHVAFGESGRANVIAAVNRLMDLLLMRAADRVWVGTPAWAEALRPYRRSGARSFDWLPVPSNVPRVRDTEATRRIRASYAAPGGGLIGHFGTYGGRIAPLLDELLPKLLEGDSTVRVLLLGRGAADYRARFAGEHAALALRLWAPSGLDDHELSVHLAAPDLFVQPYPEGLTCRRGSAMAVMGHGQPMVSNSGLLTEPIWTDSAAAVLVPFAGGMTAMAQATLRLLKDAEERARLAEAADRLYADRFDVVHTVAAFHHAAAAEAAPDARASLEAGRS